MKTAFWKKALIVFGVCVAVLAGLAEWTCQKSLPPAMVFPIRPISGAAVFYHRAFEAMPEQEKGEKNPLTPKPEEPLDLEKTAKILEHFQASFNLLSEGAKETSCEWGLDLNQSINHRLPYLTKELQLMQALRLQARWHLEKGDPSAAVDDLLLCWRFNRHIGQADLLINWLVYVTGDMLATEFAAKNLPKFDAPSLQKLANGIAVLPAPRSLQSIVAVQTRADAAQLQKILLKSRKNSENSRWVDHIPGLASFCRLYFSFMLQRFEKQSTKLTDALSLPFPEGKSKIRTFVKMENSSKWTNLFSAMILPPCASARIKEIQIEAAWTIFQTALTAQIHNPEGLRGELANLHNPYDGRPLDCQEVKEGIKVVLRATPGQRPVTLTIGQTEK